MDDDLLSPETRLQLRLQAIETALEAVKSDLAEHRAETRKRQDEQDARQQRILWAVITLVFTIAGSVLTAAVLGVLPQ